MSSKMDRVIEALDVVEYALVIAIPLGSAAAAYSATGSLVPALAISLIALCGYLAGRRRSIETWQKELNGRLIAIVEFELKANSDPRLVEMLEKLRNEQR